jgi:hypothetical protein
MSFQHDQMAHAATDRVLTDIRSGNSRWLPPGTLTAHSTYWQGVIDWPRPDNGFQDSSSGSSLALEFKPPGHGKSEYVRGLGQAVTYLNLFELALLIVPSKASDGFEIANYLRDVLNGDYAKALSIGLMQYHSDPADLSPLVHVRPRSGSAPPLPSGRPVFWAYWRWRTFGPTPNEKRKTINTKASDEISYAEFYVGKSKPTIDRVLAGHFGFTNDEPDFIINYDIKYRLGQESAAFLGKASVQAMFIGMWGMGMV